MPDAGHVVPLDELQHSAHSHEFVGAEHGDVPFSIILVHSGPGVGPKLHQHPYAEVFVVEAGQATFRIGDRTLVVDEPARRGARVHQHGCGRAVPGGDPRPFAVRHRMPGRPRLGLELSTGERPTRPRSSANQRRSS